MSSVCREPSLVASVCRASASGEASWPRPEGPLSPRALHSVVLGNFNGQNILAHILLFPTFN